MNFKQQLNKDLNVFINGDEFAEEVTIDGNEVKVVIDNDQFQENQLKHGGEGLFIQGLLFHVKKIDMPFIPYPDQIIEFNQEFYLIADIKDTVGMYSITLEARDS